MSAKRAIRRYNRTVLALSVVYAATLFATIYAFNHHLVAGAPGVLVAMLPALPIVGMFAAIARYLIEERDEYIRMLEVRKTLVATGFALSIATIWGFMESFEVVGHVESFYVAVLWFGGLGLGSCVNHFLPPRAA